MKSLELPEDLDYTIRVIYYRWVELCKAQRGRQFIMVYPDAISDKHAVYITEKGVSIRREDFRDEWTLFEIGKHQEQRGGSSYLSSDDFYFNYGEESGYVSITTQYKPDSELSFDKRLTYVYPSESYYRPKMLDEGTFFQYSLLDDCIDYETYTSWYTYLQKFIDTEHNLPKNVFVTFGSFGDWEFEMLKELKDWL